MQSNSHIQYIHCTVKSTGAAVSSTGTCSTQSLANRSKVFPVLSRNMSHLCRKKDRICISFKGDLNQLRKRCKAFQCQETHTFLVSRAVRFFFLAAESSAFQLFRSTAVHRRSGLYHMFSRRRHTQPAPTSRFRLKR